jgi:hypothetical protein
MKIKAETIRAHPRVARSRIRLHPAEVTKSEHDSEHRNAAVEKGGGATERDGAKQHCRRCGERVAGRNARHRHNHRVEEAENSRAKSVLARADVMHL